MRTPRRSLQMLVLAARVPITRGVVELAERSGVPRRTIYAAFSNGRAKPGVVAALAGALGVDAAELRSMLAGAGRG